MTKAFSGRFALALGLQLARGVIGILAIAAAFWVWGSHLAGSAALGAGLVVVALLAWRGCPTCWLSGLAAVIGSRGQNPSGQRPSGQQRPGPRPR